MLSLRFNHSFTHSCKFSFVLDSSSRLTQPRPCIAAEDVAGFGGNRHSWPLGAQPQRRGWSAHRTKTLRTRSTTNKIEYEKEKEREARRKNEKLFLLQISSLKKHRKINLSNSSLSKDYLAVLKTPFKSQFKQNSGEKLRRTRRKKNDLGKK